MSLSDRFAQIVEVYPPLGDYRSLYMLEQFGATVKLKSLVDRQQLQVQLWTNALSKFSSDGRWYGIDLPYQRTEDGDIFVFQGSFMPTGEGEYEFTYRVGLKNGDDRFCWAGELSENGHLKIEPPSLGMAWTQGPNLVEILPNIFVGNFIAASRSPELGIDAVLNLAEELTLSFPPEAAIAYKKLGTTDGSQNPISDDIITAAILWIDAQLKAGKQKILLNCRAGIGRSGSIAVAYCFYKYSHRPYDRVLELVWSKKPDIYPHRGLRKSLERLFPRPRSR